MYLTHHDLCSGILGFHLAASEAGFCTTLTCEIDPFCQQLIKKNLPHATHTSNLTHLNGSLLAPAHLVTAGIPCQPYSGSGFQLLHNDDRDLWPAALAFVRTNRPHWFVLENVSNFADVGLDMVHFDLEKIGYRTVSFTLPACAVGLPHRRDRVFLVAHSSAYRLQRSGEESLSRINDLQRLTNSGSLTTDTNRLLLFEPRLYRTLNGLPNAVDRVKALGNAIVPAVAWQVLRIIAQIERSQCPS